MAAQREFAKDRKWSAELYPHANTPRASSAHRRRSSAAIATVPWTCPSQAGLENCPARARTQSKNGSFRNRPGTARKQLRAAAGGAHKTRAARTARGPPAPIRRVAMDAAEAFRPARKSRSVLGPLLPAEKR